MRTDLFHAPFHPLHHRAVYATNHNQLMRSLRTRALVPIPPRELANIKSEYQWLGPSSGASIQSRLAQSLYPPAWGNEGEETPPLTSAEQAAVSAYFQEHILGESADFPSYHGREKHDLSFDHQAYTESLRDITNYSNTDQYIKYRHYDYICSLKKMLLTNPTPLQRQTCLDRDCPWSVYITRVAAVMFHRPMSGKVGCLEYPDMSDEEKTLLSDFSTKLAESACNTSPADKKTYLDSMRRFVPDRLPSYKVRAIQVENGHVSRNNTTIQDLHTNWGAIVFDRPWAGEAGCVPFVMDNTEGDFLINYVVRQDILQDFSGVELDGVPLKSGHQRHMERLQRTLSENLESYHFQAAQHERDRYENGEISFERYIATTRAIIYGTPWSGRMGCVEHDQMSREEIRMILRYMRRQQQLHR